MTIPEQAGKVASGAIDALKSSPGLLVLVLLQLVTLGVLAYVNEHNSDRRQERELLLLRSCIAHIPEDTRR
jgi:hypothetical protein